LFKFPAIPFVQRPPPPPPENRLQLLIDALQMRLHGSFCNSQLVRHLFVPFPFCCELQHFEFALCQRGIGLGVEAGLGAD
jgi:hypothetical protein